MSYTVELLEPDREKVVVLRRGHLFRQPSIAINERGERLVEFYASLSVTYNYNPFFKNLYNGEGLRGLSGKTGWEVAPELLRVITALPDEDPSSDYWASTAGNAREVLQNIMVFIVERPNGVFEVI